MSLRQPEWPSTLQETVNRAQEACHAEAKRPPMRAGVEGIANEHGGNSEKAEGSFSLTALPRGCPIAKGYIATSRGAAHAHE